LLRGSAEHYVHKASKIKEELVEIKQWQM
jgi:hypothetical protein